jgi:LysR family transcriptional regulator, nitrogen assimilation regulatory protein
VAAFLRAHPAVRLRLLEGTSRGMREALAEGRADLALIATREEAAPLALRAFAAEPMLVVGPPEARLRLSAPLQPRDLAGRPLILAAPPNSVRTLLDGALARAGVAAPVRAQVMPSFASGAAETSRSARGRATAE